MVEASPSDFASMGLGPDGMSFSSEKNEMSPAVERGREFLNDQLQELRSSEKYQSWLNTFNMHALNLKTEAAFAWVNIQETLNRTPVGANIDSIDDVIGLAICFSALPAWEKIKKIGRQYLESRKEAA